MKIDQVRLARQKEIAASWRDVHNCSGTLVACTGFGKTFVAMLISMWYRKKSSGKIVVIVPTLFLKEQWEEKIAYFKVNNMEVHVINSVTIGEGMDLSCDLLILDEIHKYTAEIFGTVFDRVSYKHILGLTATLRDDDERLKYITQYAPIVDEVTLEEAVNNGWVAPFTIYNLGVELSPSERIEYSRLSSGFGKAFATFGHDFKLAMRCLSDEQARINYARSLKWFNGGEPDQKRVHIAAINFRRNMSDRKKMLYKLDSKIEKVVEIVNMYPDKLIITFSESTEVADVITDLLPDIGFSYHSNLKGLEWKGESLSASKAKQLAIELFSNPYSPIRVLNTARALDMGADIPEIDLGIVTSGSSKSIQAIQRLGRTVRKLKDKSAIFVEIYAIDTQDAKWLKSRQKNIPRSSIKYISDVEDIGS